MGRLADQARTESSVAEQAETLGLIRIRSGKASTKFTPTPAGYAHTIGFLKFDLDKPQTKPGQIKIVQGWVKDFEARMTKAGGFALNDNADAANLACILSYKAYHDKKQTGEHLRYFQQMRVDDRKKVLAAAYY